MLCFLNFLDRDDDELFAEEESEEDGQRRALAEEEEVLDLLQMLLNFRDNDAGTGLHYATKVKISLQYLVYTLSH